MYKKLVICCCCAYLCTNCKLVDRVQKLENAIVKIEKNTKVNIKGDSVTAWIYAMIAGASLLYPVVIRPIRKKLNGRSAVASSIKSG
jgi:hypothetical protein